MGLFSGFAAAMPVVGDWLAANTAKQTTADQNEMNQRIASEANTFSAQQAQKQMDFQERMSSTAHQREVEDLRKAGLNPVLSANGGASSPSGSQGSVTAPHVERVPSVVGAVGAAAKDLIRFYQDLRESNSRIDLNQKSGWSQWSSAESGAEKNYASQRLLEQDRELSKKQNEILGYELEYRRAHPGATGALDVLRNYVPFIGAGAGVARAVIP